MNTSTIDYRVYCNTLSDFIFSLLNNDEQLACTFSGEHSTFMRFNNAKIRQTGSVEQLEASITMWRESHTFSTSIMLSFDEVEDQTKLETSIRECRNECKCLPEDPYQAIPTACEKSEAVYDGSLLDTNSIQMAILEPVQDLDFTGLFSQGSIIRASANSSGARHWFETKNFVLDFSVWLKNGRAVKSCYSGRNWSNEDYEEKIESARQSLIALEKEQIELKSGKYRAFISSDALHEFVDFFSWNGLGEKDFRHGESAFIALREGREKFSNKITISQDFSLGTEPRFNDMGEVAPERIVLIENGELKNTLVSSRTAKEYGIESNGAGEDEGVHSFVMDAGTLDEKEALTALGTGIYISNFHYLNWSDVQNARITGMTRFSCMWVENGKIVAPIKDMRWDDSLYNLLGKNLEAITQQQHLFSETSTYDRREIGSCLLPGILVSELNCTL